jgi:hypothetical protein
VTKSCGRPLKIKEETMCAASKNTLASAANSEAGNFSAPDHQAGFIR